MPDAPTFLSWTPTRRPVSDRLTGRVRIVHADATTLAGQLPYADVLLVWDFTSDAVRPAWPGDGPRPRWVHTASAGVDRLLCPELAASDTVVTNARGVFDQPIAEYVAALVLAMAKDLPGTLELQRAAPMAAPGDAAGRRHPGLRRRVAGRSAGPSAGRSRHSVSPSALVGRTPREAGIARPRATSTGCWPGRLGGVRRAADRRDTRGMFDARRFGLMQPSARFINVGRGPARRRGGPRRGAVEAPDRRGRARRLRRRAAARPTARCGTCPGLIVSPHMSGDTVGWRDELGEQFLEMFERGRRESRCRTWSTSSAGTSRTLTTRPPSVGGATDAPTSTAPHRDCRTTPRRLPRRASLVPVEVTRAALDRAEAVQPEVNAFVRVDADAGARPGRGRPRSGGGAVSRPGWSTGCR